MDDHNRALCRKIAETVRHHAADVCEAERQKILRDPTDPSWTEHLAAARSDCLAIDIERIIHEACGE